MNKIITFSKNPFYTIEASRDDIQFFIYDHIQRSKYANNPAFATFIATTEALWTQLFGSLQDYDKIYNEQQNFTKQVVAQMKEFKTKVIKMDPFVQVKFDKTTGTYQEFYPFGHDEYHHLNQGSIVKLMERMISVSDKYSADIGPTWKDEYTLMYNTFQTTFATQKQKKGGKAQIPNDYEAKKLEIYDQMYQNMGIIMSVYNKTPEKLVDFFDETIVNYVSHIHPLKISAGTQKASDLEYGINDVIVITSKFDKVLKYFFAATPDATSGTTPAELPANAKIYVTGTLAGAPENKNIIVINETDTDANVELRLE